MKYDVFIPRDRLSSSEVERVFGETGGVEAVRGIELPGAYVHVGAELLRGSKREGFEVVGVSADGSAHVEARIVDMQRMSQFGATRMEVCVDCGLIREGDRESFKREAEKIVAIARRSPSLKGFGFRLDVGSLVLNDVLRYGEMLGCILAPSSLQSYVSLKFGFDPVLRNAGAVDLVQAFKGGAIGVKVVSSTYLHGFYIQALADGGVEGVSCPNAVELAREVKGG